MRVEEVKTSFIADTQKYIKDIQKAQKVLNTFLNTNDMTKKEKAENRLQVAIQKRAQAQAKALTEELKLKRQVDSTNSKLVSSQNNVNKSISKSTSSSKMFAGELAHMARNVMTLYYSVKSLGKVLTTGIDFNKTKENARLAFTVMFRSADVATQKIKELQEYAIASPLSFKETISASKQLSAYGFAAEELVPAMEMLGTVAKATGHSLDDISYVYGTLRTQGRAYSRDLMQFSMRGIPIYEELAEVLKVDQKEIKKLTEEGKVGFKEVEKAFKNMTKEGGKFGGLLDEYMKGFEGIASQLEDTFQQSMGQMTEPMFEALKTQMKELIQLLGKGGLDKLFADIGKSIASLIPILAGALKTILLLLPAIINFGKILLTLFVSDKLIGGTIKAFHAFSASIGGFARFSNVALKPLIAFSKATFAKGVGNSFAAIIKGIKGMGVVAKAFAMANPWLLAILAGGIVATAIINIKMKKIEKEREFIEKYGDTKQLIEFDVATDRTRANIKKGLMTAGAFGASLALPIPALLAGVTSQIPALNRLIMEKISPRMTVDAVKELAQQYGTTALELADILLRERLIGREVHNIIRDEQTRARAAQRYREFLETNVQLQQQAYLNERLGYDLMSKRFALTDRARAGIATIYKGIGEVDQTDVFWTAGGRAGAEYTTGIRDGLKSREAELKKAYNDTVSFADPNKGRQLFNTDMMVDHYKSALEEVNTLLEEGAKIPLLYEQTTWDEELRKLKEELEEALEKSGSAKKAVEIKLDPWFDREKMAAATKMVFDDIELQRDKDLATAQEKLDAQEISQAQYFRAVNAIHVKHLDDMISAEKNAANEVRDLWREGSEDWWGDVRLKTHKQIGNMAKNFSGVLRGITPKFLFNITKESFKIDKNTFKFLITQFKDAAQSIWSYMKSVFGGINNFFSSMRNPFSLGKSDSALIKIDINKEELGRNLGIIGSQLKAFGSAIADVSIKAYKLAGQFMDFSVELAKIIGMSLLDGSQIGNIMSMVGGGRDAWVQAKKDDLIAGGYDVTNFDEEQAATGFDVFGAVTEGILTQSIMAFVEMISAVEEVSQVINAFDTIMKSAGRYLESLFSVGFSGVASVLEELGEVLGSVLLPVFHPLLLAMHLLAGILKISIIPILQIVGNVFKWLYDRILVPFGNAIIGMVNGLIGLLNKIPGINIAPLRYFETTTQMIADTAGHLNATMEYMVKKLNDLIDKEIATLGDLYDVGAISGAEYAKQVDAANLKRLSLDENMVDINVAQLDSITSIYDWLVRNGAYPDIEALLAADKAGVTLPSGFYDPEKPNTTGGTVTSTPTATLGGNIAGLGLQGLQDAIRPYAVGTSSVPYDMIAQIHKGEGIVPRTFMDSIRAGELQLSGAGNGGGPTSVNNYYIDIEGSVMAENDLADTLANKIEQRRTRGYGRK